MSWLDLSHAIGPQTPYLPPFGAVSVQRVRRMPADPFNATHVGMGCHVGTHIDAPSHFIPGGASIDEISLDRLCGTGVVIPLNLSPREAIEPDHFEDAKCAPVHPGDLVFLDTGWWRYAGTSQYRVHPALTPESAQWLVDRGVRLIAVDFSTPDIPSDDRPSNFDWPVHHILLRAGVLIVENVTGLSPLAGKRIEAMCLPINIAGADGAPARVVARHV